MEGEFWYRIDHTDYSISSLGRVFNHRVSTYHTPNSLVQTQIALRCHRLRWHNWLAPGDLAKHRYDSEELQAARGLVMLRNAVVLQFVNRD